MHFTQHATCNNVCTRQCSRIVMKYSFGCSTNRHKDTFGNQQHRFMFLFKQVFVDMSAKTAQLSSTRTVFVQPQQHRSFKTDHGSSTVKCNVKTFEYENLHCGLLCKPSGQHWYALHFCAQGV